MAEEGVASSTVTAIRIPEAVDVEKLKQILAEGFNIMVAETGHLTSIKGLRIAHMGVTAAPDYLMPALAALEASLLKLNFPLERGAAIKSALYVFREGQEETNWVVGRFITLMRRLYLDYHDSTESHQQSGGPCPAINFLPQYEKREQCGEDR